MALAHKGLDYETVPVAFTEIPAIEGGSTATVPLLPVFVLGDFFK